MTAVPTTQNPSRKKRGKALSLVLRAAELATTHHVTVVGTQMLHPQFLKITLTAEWLVNKDWEPGQKVDLQVGELSYRAYTPVSFMPKSGELGLLVYIHGNGPGAKQLPKLQAGDRVRMRGFVSSTLLDPSKGRLVFFGDETSLGLMVAHQTQEPLFRGQDCIVETLSSVVLQQMLARLNLEDAAGVIRSDDDSHLRVVGEKLAAVLSQDEVGMAVLTGRAASIQKLRKVLIAQGIQPTSIETHAYWAEGKVALG